MTAETVLHCAELIRRIRKFNAMADVEYQMKHIKIYSTADPTAFRDEVNFHPQVIRNMFYAEIEVLKVEAEQLGVEWEEGGNDKT